MSDDGDGFGLIYENSARRERGLPNNPCPGGRWPTGCQNIDALDRARALLREVLEAQPCKYLNGIHASDCTVEAIRAFLDGGA